MRGYCVNLRKQFILSHESLSPTLPSYALPEQKKLSGGYAFRYSSDLEFSFHEGRSHWFLLIGKAYDLNALGKGLNELVAHFHNCIDFSEVVETTKFWVGRWILVFGNDKRVIVLGDPSNTKGIYYSFRHGSIIVGADPNLLALAIDEAETAEGTDFSLRFVMSRKGDWWPGEATAYKSIKALLANHFVSSESQEVFRYWPTRPRTSMSYQSAIEEAGSLLRRALRTIAFREPVALPVTAGLDSRLLLAASLPMSDRIHYFVSAHGGKTHSYPDIAVPKALFRSLQIPFHVYEGTAVIASGLLPEFRRCHPQAKPEYIQFAFPSHPDWPKNIQTVLEGPVNEVGCRYYGNRLFSLDPKELCRLAAMSGDFPERHMKAWLEDAQEACQKTRYEALDLFYWEQRTGRWVSKIANELDFFFDPVYPYNCRAYLDLIVSIPFREKNYPNRKFFVDLISYLEPKLLEFPINPCVSFSDAFIRLVRRTPVEKYFRNLFYQLQEARIIK